MVGSGAGSELEHPNLGNSKLHQFEQPPKAGGIGLGGAQSPPLFVLIFLFYFILFYFNWIYIFFSF